MFNKRIIGFTISATLVLAAITPSFAVFYYSRMHMKSNPNATTGGFIWSIMEYIDFSSTSSNSGRQWDINGAGEKFAYFTIPGQPGGGYQCYEISTTKSTDGQVAETLNADTKLTILDPSQTVGWKVINNDFGGTKYSRTRVWASSSTNLVGYVSAGTSAANNIDFYLITKSLKYTTAVACKGTGIPFVSAISIPYSFYY